MCCGLISLHFKLFLKIVDIVLLQSRVQKAESVILWGVLVRMLGVICTFVMLWSPSLYPPPLSSASSSPRLLPRPPLILSLLSPPSPSIVLHTESLPVVYL